MKSQSIKMSALQLCLGMFFATAMLKGDGSFVLLNKSLYTIKMIVTAQNAGATTYTQATIPSAPTNSDGTLQIHPTDTYYVAGSNVPVGTLANVVFQGAAQNFDLQILDGKGNILKQINVGSTLGAVVNTDPARVVYVYNNVDSNGNAVANKGGAVYFWDMNHSLQQPWSANF